MDKWGLSALAPATWETIYMVFIASFISILLGLALGTVLFSIRSKPSLDKKIAYQILGLIVNATRSIPFIILLIILIPLTRLIVGTSIGIHAALVPLTIAAIPFYARICEAALSEVPYGLIEAAHAMGANEWQIVSKILIPESLPSLVKGATLTIIGLIGYSAMAGTVGGGGLGELAINYGYQQFNLWIMTETVVILIVIVQLTQWLGDYVAKNRRLKPIAALSVLLWIGCIGNQVWASHAHQSNAITVGIMSGKQEKIMRVAQKVSLKKYHLPIKLVTFSDYVQPNMALNNGDIDANIFQHIPYLNAQKKARGYHLTAIARTFNYPLGFYSKKIKSLRQLHAHSIVVLPNDPSNQGRALLLLQQANLIRLKPGVGLMGTVRDIVSNPKQLQFKAIDAAQTPHTLQDAALVAINNDYLEPLGLTVKQALIRENKHSPYANVIVVRTSDQHDDRLSSLIDTMHSPEVIKATQKAYPNGGAIPAW